MDRHKLPAIACVCWLINRWLKQFFICSNIIIFFLIINRIRALLLFEIIYCSRVSSSSSKNITKFITGKILSPDIIETAWTRKWKHTQTSYYFEGLKVNFHPCSSTDGLKENLTNMNKYTYYVVYFPWVLITNIFGHLAETLFKLVVLKSRYIQLIIFNHCLLFVHLVFSYRQLLFKNFRLWILSHTKIIFLVIIFYSIKKYPNIHNFYFISSYIVYVILIKVFVYKQPTLNMKSLWIKIYKFLLHSLDKIQFFQIKHKLK